MTTAVAYLVMALPVAGQQMYGPFFVDPKFPPVIFLNGEIDERSALQFRRALEANPQVEYLALNSPGGLVQMGLLIADEVHSRKLTTLIPEGFECSSSCSLIFLAGHRRAVAGKLGVHQISAASPDMEKAQLTISDIVEALNRYDTPPEVLTKMLRTPPDDMYYFSAEEVAALGLNRDGAAPNVEPAAPAPQSIEPTKTSEAVALEFVQDVVNTHARISASQASGVRRFYADQLGYYGKRLAIDEVLADKQAYFQRWPQRSTQIRPGSVTVTCYSALCHVRGQYDWEVRSPERNKMATGLASFSYMLDMAGSVKIIAEGGEVIR